jgi:phospholipid N-methyltransferase
MSVLPPGTLLQLLYLQERISQIPAGRFVEIGPGRGEISNLLLKNSWIGTAYELNPDTVVFLNKRFSSEIAAGQYSVTNKDWLMDNADNRYELIISCMVMEHLDSENERKFLQQAVKCLQPTGTLICFVPGSPRHWGIEDEIAGHFRRYSRNSIIDTLSSENLQVDHLVGLTYPISNLLLPLSNWLVRRNESKKLNLSKLERTKQSGFRKVAMKTHFPAGFALLLNRFTIYPLHIFQKIFRNSKNSLVLYFEAKVAAKH